MRGKRSEPHRRTCGGLKRARSIETSLPPSVPDGRQTTSCPARPSSPLKSRRSGGGPHTTGVCRSRSRGCSWRHAADGWRRWLRWRPRPWASGYRRPAYPTSRAFRRCHHRCLCVRRSSHSRRTLPSRSGFLPTPCRSGQGSWAPYPIPSKSGYGSEHET